ncbi:ferritin-like domain-containing protein [bacterium]|nr:MAG: ferritin-like domain-containing protein [bacterium]
MQESINPTQGETPSPSYNKAIITGAALVGGAALLAATPKVARAVTPALTFADIPGSGDVKVLNYALALEALEANLYEQALARLIALNVSANDPVRSYVAKFGIVEKQHRDFLIGAIKAANNNTTILDGPLAGATFNFGGALETAESILDFLITVEDTGTNAYLGAIPSFTPKSPYLPTAAAIQGTEARHTAALIVIRNRKYPAKVESPAPLFNENNGIDGIIREAPFKGANPIPNTILAAVSPYIVLPTNN